ncbi:MAG: WD40 repeat domain-containing serine/threonine protein kinase [Chloroflexota bacterium]
MFDNQGIESLIGRTFKGFRVTRYIARGGMGMVFAGVQESLDRPVAIKFLYPHLSDDDQFRERFEREARAAAGLNHPNIVRIIDFGSEDGLHYMIMDFIEGESLRDRLARIHNEGLTFGSGKIISILRQVGGALSHAHELGYVHRDVKPGNILLTRDDRALLTDFGVVKVVDSTGMTATGTMIGTPEYMAPEQSTGMTDIGPAADLYSLAVIAYEMMTGRVPFQAPTPAAVMKMHMTDPPPPPSSIVPSFSPAAEAVLMRALSKHPHERQESVDAFIDDLEAAINQPGQSGIVPPTADQSVAAYMAGAAETSPHHATTGGYGTVPPQDPPTTQRPAASAPRWIFAGGAAAVLLLLVLGAAYLLGLFGNGDDDPNSPAAASGETATETQDGAEGAAESPEGTEAAPEPTATEEPQPTETPEPEPTEPAATATEPEPTATEEEASNPEPTADDSEQEGQPTILYAAVSEDGQESQISIMNPDGSDPQPLTEVDGQPHDPRISPDGSWFVYTVVTPGEEEEGAYGEDEAGEETTDIYVASADGEEVINLTEDSADWYGHPSWSPDGERIAFTSDRDGNWEIYTMTREGEDIRRITEEPARDAWPVWTPDGERIVFASDRNGAMDIYSMDNDWTNVEQLTDWPDTVDTRPAVSPDGSQIAFVSQNPDTGESEIYVMDIDGEYTTQLTEAGGVNTAPAWSPDGEQIIFESDRDGNRNIYIMNADGTGQARLTDNSWNNGMPAWASNFKIENSQGY